MKPDELSQFAEGLLMFELAWGLEIKKPTIEVYFKLLIDLPLESFLTACEKILRTEQASYNKLPLPATFIKYAKAGSSDDMYANAVNAWGHVEKAIRHHGRYATITFDDKKINASILSIGGWRELCACPVGTEYQWRQKNFIDAYQKYSVTPPPHGLTKPLGGNMAAEPIFISTGSKNVSEGQYMFNKDNMPIASLIDTISGKMATEEE